MNRLAHCFASFAFLAATAVALGACSGGSASSEEGPLVGTWTYSGSVPDVVTVRVTFDSDKTFTFTETIAPLTSPGPEADAGNLSGYVGCVVSNSYQGTYDTTGASTLTMNFASGTANIVVGCASSADDSSGQPMGEEAIDGARVEGLIPAQTETYDVTSTTLVLTPPNANALGGFSTSTKTLTKVP